MTKANEPVQAGIFRKIGDGVDDVRVASEKDLRDIHARLIHFPGLTKREHFAAMAMQALLSKYNLREPEDQKTVTDLSVQLSDSLIISLNQSK